MKLRTNKQEILAEATWRRRQQRLDQVEIPASEVEIMEGEVLGKGPGGGGGSSNGFRPGGVFSTAVYLANCNGLNAAVKVFSFKAGAFEPGQEHRDDRALGSGGGSELKKLGRRRHGSARAGCGFQKNLGGVAASVAAAKNRGMHEEEEEIDWMFGEAGNDDGRRHASLVREVAALRRLRNPRVVTIYGAVVGGGTGGSGSLAGGLLLAMELLPGGSLRQRLQRSVPLRSGWAPALPLSLKTLRGIVKDVCAGVAFLHGEAFVHGGLSSTNVLLDAKGRAKVGGWTSLLCVKI